MQYLYEQRLDKNHMLAMCRVYRRDASAPRRGELYLRNYFLVDAIRIFPIVVPVRAGSSCCHLCSGRRSTRS